MFGSYVSPLRITAESSRNQCFSPHVYHAERIKARRGREELRRRDQKLRSESLGAAFTYLVVAISHPNPTLLPMVSTVRTCSHVGDTRSETNVILRSPHFHHWMDWRKAKQ